MFVALGVIMIAGDIILTPIQLRNNKKVREALKEAERERNRAIVAEALKDFLPSFWRNRPPLLLTRLRVRDSAPADGHRGTGRLVAAGLPLAHSPRL